MKKVFIISAVFLSIFFATFLFLPKSLADGNLLAYWKLDESNFGSSVIDSSGNGYNGTPHNDPLPQEEKPPGIQFTDPYSLNFDKSQWVSIPDNPAFTMSSATFSVWVKFTSLSDDMNMIAKRSGDGSQIQWQFGYSGGLQQFKVSLANNGGNGCCQDYNWSPNPAIQTNTWYNIAVTINGTSKKLRWYQNGQFQTEQDITGSNLGTQIATADLVLGASQNGLTERLHGILDDVRIYNAALTDQEVLAIGTGESGPGVPTPTPTPTPSPTPTATPTQSPTPTPSLQNNSNSGSSSNNTSPASCTSPAPTGTPDLFQIDSNQTHATLFFAPASGNVTNYTISYGYTSGDERFSIFTNQGNSTGVLSYTINFLSPNLTYYFRVKPFNECMPGNWSNEMKITTTKNNNTIRYYKNFLSQILSIFPQKTTKLTSTTNKTQITKACEDYTAQPGDSLWQIAQDKFGDGTKYQLIQTSNHLNTTVLNVGQKLKLGC